MPKPCQGRLPLHWMAQKQQRPLQSFTQAENWPEITVSLLDVSML